MITAGRTVPKPSALPTSRTDFSRGYEDQPQLPRPSNQRGQVTLRRGRHSSITHASLPVLVTERYPGHGASERLRVRGKDGVHLNEVRTVELIVSMNSFRPERADTGHIG
jgi:hypothetical protein